MNEYISSIVRYHLGRLGAGVEADRAERAKLYLLDCVGCMLASRQDCRKELAFIAAMSPTEECTVPGTGLRLSMPLAAFAGSVLASAQELDDATSVGASVHPGCCVIPAALAAAERYGSSADEFLGAILFGYDLCNRLGLLATEKIRELGLYGPGVIAAPSAAAAAGALMGLTGEEVENAISIALSMSPMCPFSAFTDGADAKDLYAGWGTYLGVLAAQLASGGFSGPEDVLDGEKSLGSIFSSGKGRDVPPGDSRYERAVQFKKYSGCLSVRATMEAIAALRAGTPFSADDIESVQIETYPYACDLDRLTGNLNTISARASLAYTSAVMLCTGKLGPEAFREGALSNPEYISLMGRTKVGRLPGAQSGPFGGRDSQVTLTLRDGRILTGRYESAKNAGSTLSPEELVDKFMCINKDSLESSRLRELAGIIMNLDKGQSLKPLLDALCTLN